MGPIPVFKKMIPFKKVCHQKKDLLEIYDLPFCQIFVYFVKKANSEVSQDAFAVRVNSQSIAFCVADGIGGGKHGDIASLMGVTAWVAESQFSESDVEAINQQILELIEGAGTTFTSFELTRDGSGRFLIIGDSSAAIWNLKSGLRYRSYDHGPAGEELKAGEIDEKQFFLHREKHILHNALGADDLFVENVTHSPITLNDLVLIASDGFWDNIYLPDLAALIDSNLEGTAKKMVDFFESKTPLGPSRDWKLDDATLLLMKLK